MCIRDRDQAMPRENQLLTVSVSLVVNRIATARLVYLDGLSLIHI